MNMQMSGALNNNWSYLLQIHKLINVQCSPYHLGAKFFCFVFLQKMSAMKGIWANWLVTLVRLVFQVVWVTVVGHSLLRNWPLEWMTFTTWFPSHMYHSPPSTISPCPQPPTYIRSHSTDSFTSTCLKFSSWNNRKYLPAGELEVSRWIWLNLTLNL